MRVIPGTRYQTNVSQYGDSSYAPENQLIKEVDRNSRERDKILQQNINKLESELQTNIDKVESESKERDNTLQQNIDLVNSNQGKWNEEQDERLYKLENSITGDGRYVFWNYTAKAGDKIIKIPYMFYNIFAVYINGAFQIYGKDKSYVYSTTDYTVTFNDAIGLDEGDEVTIAIGREPVQAPSSEFDGSVPMPEPRQYGDGVTTRFKAPHTAPADANAFFVYIDGVKQSAEAGDYSVPAVLALDFSEAPPVGAAVDITYFRPMTNDGLLVKSFESESVFMIRVNDAGVISTVKL